MDQKSVLKRLAALGQSILEPGVKLTSIGIAAPGPLNTEGGRHHQGGNAARLVSCAHRPIPKPSIRRRSLTVVENDGNLGALAEYHLGAGRGADPVIYLTISTRGIGGVRDYQWRAFHRAQMIWRLSRATCGLRYEMAASAAWKNWRLAQRLAIGRFTLCAHAKHPRPCVIYRP